MKKFIGLLLALYLLTFLFAGGSDQVNFPAIYIDESVAPGGVGSLADPYSDFSEVNWTTGGDNSIFDWYAGAEDASATINLKKGEEWREQLTVGGSGSATYPIIIQAYGDGDAPIINGSTDVQTWADQGGSVWKATLAVEPRSVWFVETDDSISWGIEVANVGALAAEYDWVWDTNALYCFAASDPDTRYNFVEASQRDGGIASAVKTYITVQNLEIVFFAEIGVEARLGSNWLIDSNLIHHGGEWNVGWPYSDGVQVKNHNDTTVSNNIIHNTGVHGVLVVAQDGATTADDNIVEYNIIYDCYHTGIDAQTKDDSTLTNLDIRYNYIYWTSDYDTSLAANGIYILQQDAGALDGCKIYYNVIHDLVFGSGIGVNEATNLTIYNNTIYGVLSGYSGWACGIKLDPASAMTLKNNIIAQIHIAAGSRCLYIVDSSNKTIDYNIYEMQNAANDFAFVDDTDYNASEWASYKSTTGFDANSPAPQDPLFVGAANDDFRLLMASPCVDAGTDVSLTTDYRGRSIRHAPDIGAYEDPTSALFLTKLLDYIKEKRNGKQQANR